MTRPHYLRFARTLALATTITLPACSGADASAPADPADKRDYVINGPAQFKVWPQITGWSY